MSSSPTTSIRLPLWLLIALVLNLPAWWTLGAYQFDGASRLQSLGLIDTLLVVVWYAHVTSELLSVSRRQLAQSSRPCVVIDWEFVETDRRYVARNVGAGIALNVVLFEDIEAKSQNPIHLGSLGPREFTFLPTNFVDLLRKEAGDDHLTRKRHVLLAEQIDSEEWIVTENLVELQGRVSHRTRIKRLGSSLLGEIHKKTFNEYVDENWPAIQADLDSMLKALKPSNE